MFLQSNAFTLKTIANSLLNNTNESPPIIQQSPLTLNDHSYISNYENITKCGPIISPSVTPASIARHSLHESNDTFVIHPNILSSNEFILITPKDAYNQNFFPRKILHQREITGDSDIESQISVLSMNSRDTRQTVTSVSFHGGDNRLITMSTVNGRHRHSFLSQSSLFSFHGSGQQSLVIRDSLLDGNIAEEQEDEFPDIDRFYNSNNMLLIKGSSETQSDSSSDFVEMNLTALSFHRSSAFYGSSFTDDENYISVDEDMKYDDMHVMYNRRPTEQMIEKQADIRVEMPVNAAPEMLGNFIAAQCGLCVPSMDIISSADSAAAYHVLQKYMNNTDQESGKPPTLLAYEELDGVSLGDLRTQLNQVQITIKYKKESPILVTPVDFEEDVSFAQQTKLSPSALNNTNGRTTHEQIQRFFVSVVKKTFGSDLPNEFSRDGRAILRDCGFIFALDMFLFNISRFPVSLPFEGIGNAQNLWISTDSDGDSALYGLQNRFMGGFDIIELPAYLLPGRNINTENGMQYALRKQKEYCEQYAVILQKFLSALSDYYTNQIKKNVDNKSLNTNKNNTNVNENINNFKTVGNLLHAKPQSPKGGSWDDSRMKAQKHSSTIDGNAVLQKCLRPLAKHVYVHCGFELLIIDEFNKKKLVANMSEAESLKILSVYRDALLDHMITLVCEGILIGITEISDQLEAKDIDIIVRDIKSLDANMSGIELINVELLKLVLRLFQSNLTQFELDIEDSSSDGEIVVDDGLGFGYQFNIDDNDEEDSY